MDFDPYHLSREIYKGGNNWSVEDVLYRELGSLFLLRSDKTAYNTMDAGNWLWGNANNRLGNSQGKIAQLANMYNSNDSDDDRCAITYGWYHAGFNTSVPTNRYFILRFNKMLDVLDAQKTKFVQGTDHIIRHVFAVSKINQYNISLSLCI